jgi:hypothetical protein
MGNLDEDLDKIANPGSNASISSIKIEAQAAVLLQT